MISELIIVAMVINPPPPRPVSPLMRFRKMILGARPHPRHPSKKVIVAVKKHARRPRMSEKRPYKGWKAVVVMRYSVVSQEMVFAALKSEPITAYVDAVIVPSKPERNTLQKMARYLVSHGMKM
jgi:hypothetical protein